MFRRPPPAPPRRLPAALAMRAGTLPRVPLVARTVVVLGWLVALAVAGRPAWAAVLLGLALVGLWLAALLLAPRPVRRAFRGRGMPSAGRGG